MYEDLTKDIVDRLPGMIDQMNAETLMQILPEDLFIKVLKCLYDYVFEKATNDLSNSEGML